ncbi:MAG: dolichyl-phosphate beta-glucosyltransferase [Pycnora praestabilis]|nr:MAG: dolichyl-phosphate beta-glucosyltransferase [Pycnora praestabilis]
MDSFDSMADWFHRSLGLSLRVPLPLLLLILLTTIFGFASFFYLALFIAAPIPRPPLKSEKTYTTILPSGDISDPKSLPCWQDCLMVSNDAVQRKGNFSDSVPMIEEPEVFISVVVPAYNEEERLGDMLEEAVEYLQKEYGNAHAGDMQKTPDGYKKSANGSVVLTTNIPSGWEILIVSDGSTDKTIQTALAFARDHQLSQNPVPVLGPRTQYPDHATHIPHGSIRVISLRQNRGKGGAVTHGFRHVRGKFAIFADADGASKFEDLGKLVRECQRKADAEGRAVAVGSRAHLVGSEAVVKRSFLRNLLMHSFHLLLRLLTPPATAAIRDTQCGFKLFSRSSLPYIIPYMHSEGWIFDVEMLMLAESAGIPVVEVPVGWKEVKGSKLNVIWDSLGMAWSLAVLRGAWGFGVYRRS